MNDNYIRIVEENKQFIEYIYMLFIHFHKIESIKKVTLPMYVGENITKRIPKELEKTSFFNCIENISVLTQDSIEFWISILDKSYQHWSFTVDFKNNIKLKRCSRFFTTGEVYSVSEEEIKININNFSKDKKDNFILDSTNIEESIELIKLKHDIDFSYLDLTDAYFKNIESLSFIRELK